MLDTTDSETGFWSVTVAYKLVRLRSYPSKVVCLALNQRLLGIKPPTTAQKLFHGSVGQHSTKPHGIISMSLPQVNGGAPPAGVDNGKLQVGSWNPPCSDLFLQRPAGHLPRRLAILPSCNQHPALQALPLHAFRPLPSHSLRPWPCRGREVPRQLIARVKGESIGLVEGSQLSTLGWLLSQDEHTASDYYFDSYAHYGESLIPAHASCVQTGPV